MAATELAKAYVQIVPSADGITDSMTAVLEPEASRAGQQAGAQFSGGFSGGISSAVQMGVGAIGTVVSAVGSATGAFIDGVGSVAEYGDNIDKMAQKMGMSIESYQEWDAVMQHSGTSMEAMKSSMKTLANAAESGSEAFTQLGISQEEIANMSQEQLFERTISALQNVEDSTQRTYLAGKVLGRGATELGALLNTSAEDTQAMRDRVRELGGVMSEDAVKAAAAYQDSLQDMQTAFSGLSRNLLAEFLPSVTSVMDGLTEIFAGNSEQGIGMITTGIQDLLNDIGEVLPQFVTMATSIITAIAETIIQNLPQIVESGLGILVTLAGSLMENLPLIGESILGVIDVIVNTLTEYGPTLLEQGFNMVMNLAMGIVENVPSVLDAFAQGVDQAFQMLDESLPGFLDKGFAAIEQLAMGIIQDLPSIIESLGQISSSAISFLMEHLPEFLQKGIELVSNIAQGIMDNLPEIISSIAEVIAELIATIAEHLPDFLQKGIELLGQVGAGLIQAIPDLISNIPTIISNIVDAFAQYDWLSIGTNIISGIGSGITSAAGDLASAAVDAVSNAWDAMTGWLDINSPSKKAKRVIGRNWALGVGEGFEDEMPSATKDMIAATRRTMGALSGTIANPRISPTGALTSDNSGDVITAISDLKQAIMSMQIVMDSGNVVGSIQELMDGALGREAQRAVWQ